MSDLTLSADLKSYVESLLRDSPADAAWHDAWSKEDYSTALVAIENALNEKPDDLQAKIWWVRAQLQLNQVPLSALAASLTGVISTAVADSKLAAPMLGTVIALSERLIDKSQGRLALSLLHESNILVASDANFSKLYRREFTEFVLALVRSELSKVETKRSAAQYIEELRGKERAYEKQLSDLPKSTPKPASRPRLDAKAILSEAIAEDDQGAALSSKPWELGEKGKTEEFKQFPFAVDEQRQQRLRIGLGILGILVLMLSWHFIFSPSKAASGTMLLAMNTSFAANAEPALANLPILRNDGISDKLASLNSNLEQVGERIKTLGSGTSPATTEQIEGQNQTSNSGEIIVPPDKNTHKDAEVDQAALESKAAAKLKTSTTSAREEIEPIDTSPKADLPAPDPKKAPYLDPNRLARIPVDELGNSGGPPRRPLDNPALRDLRVGPDGRVYGPPPNVDAARRIPDAKTLDGKPLQSYPVEDFPQGIKYRTIVPVQVLSAPSERAIPLSRLDRDATVQVFSKMGPWLELRSTGGRTGYMYAQDAVPAE